MSRSIRVADIMRPATCIRTTADIIDAIAELGGLSRDEQLVVVDDSDRPAGLLDYRDCLELLTHGDPVDHLEPSGEVGAFLRTTFISLRPDYDVYYATGRLAHAQTCYPVTDINGKLVGQVSSSTIFRVVCSGYFEQSEVPQRVSA